MHKPDLKFNMDNDGQPLLGGSVLSGELEVACADAVTCAGIKVTLEWSAHGRGNRHTVVVDTLTLPGGSWAEWEQLRIPLTFAVPNGPASYRGTLLDVDWRLRAELDLPDGLDSAAHRLVVNANPALPWEGPQKPLRVAPTPVPAAKLVGSGLQGVLGAIVGFLFFVFFSVATCGSSGASVGCALLVLAPLVLFPALSAPLKKFRRAARSLKVGDVVTTLAETSVAPGEALMLSIDVSPRFDVELEGAFVILRSVEVVMSGSANGPADPDEEERDEEEDPDALAAFGPPVLQIETETGSPLSTRTRHKHTGIEIKVPFAEAQRIPAASLWTQRVAIPVPAEAVPSFACPDNVLRWEAEVRLEVRRAPDWFRIIHVEVRPRPPSRALEGLQR